MIPGFENDPLVEGDEYLDRPLFWPSHLGSWLRDEKAQELAFGADWEAAEELHAELGSADRWPVFSVPVFSGCVIRVIYRNFEGDAGVDYVLHDPAAGEALLLASDEGSFRGPGLSWRELDGVATDARSLLLLLPMLGDADVPLGATDRVAAALAELTWVEEPELLAGLLLDEQGQWGRANWRERDGVWICDGAYSDRCPHNGTSFIPEQLAKVSAALN
ncbi:hypothetical protein LFM09_00670 [Lentzea alba]|uniref:hypothetical protein n=1 Tax=Lentzea alba TaxID=2714351 RepID=UPI0039BFA63F